MLSLSFCLNWYCKIDKGSKSGICCSLGNKLLRLSLDWFYLSFSGCKWGQQFFLPCDQGTVLLVSWSFLVLWTHAGLTHCHTQCWSISFPGVWCSSRFPSSQWDTLTCRGWVTLWTAQRDENSSSNAGKAQLKWQMLPGDDGKSLLSEHSVPHANLYLAKEHFRVFSCVFWEIKVTGISPSPNAEVQGHLLKSVKCALYLDCLCSW